MGGSYGTPFPFGVLMHLPSVISDVAGDVRFALRSWRRHPGFAVVALVSLAVGLGLNTTVFSVINTIFLQSIRGVPEPSQVVSLGGRVGFTTYREIRDSSQTLAGVAAWQPAGAGIRYGDVALHGLVHAASEGYFQVLGVRPARGRFFDPAPSRHPRPIAAVVLDHVFWTDVLAASPSAIGDTIVVDGVPATILGVAPRAFNGFGPERPRLWISMDMWPASQSTVSFWESADAGGWRVFGRLRRGTPLEQVQAELQVLAARSPMLIPEGALRVSTGRPRWTGAVSAEKRIEFLLVVVLPLVVVCLILWIGCSNVANLLLARAATRRREIAIRLAAGASRLRLVRMLLIEALLLALGGAALGLLLAAWTMDIVWAAVPEAQRLAVHVDASVLLYTGAIAVAATLLFGLVPALQATRLDITPLLKGEEARPDRSVRGLRVRTFFLVTQFAASMALLVVAGTFVRTLVATYVGEQSLLIDHLATAYVESDSPEAGARTEGWRTLREELVAIPDVVSVTLMDPGAAIRSRLVPEGRAADSREPSVAVQAVDPGFVRTTGLALVSGWDDPAPASDEPVEHALVNEKAARQFWGTTDVLGERFALEDLRDLRIAGVVRDDGAEPRVFRPMRDETLAAAHVLIRTSRPSEAMLPILRSVILSRAPDRLTTQVSTMRATGFGALERLMWLALVVAAVALSLASVGLYGAMAFTTSQRTREIAIRMAVGASRPALLRLLAREGLLVVACGSALGLALTALAFRFMSGMIFARWTLDPITVGAVLVTLAAATLCACYLPGRRAVRIEPMSVLRSD